MCGVFVWCVHVVCACVCSAHVHVFEISPSAYIDAIELDHAVHVGLMVVDKHFLFPLPSFPPPPPQDLAVCLVNGTSPVMVVWRCTTATSGVPCAAISGPSLYCSGYVQAVRVPYSTGGCTTVRLMEEMRS